MMRVARANYNVTDMGVKFTMVGAFFTPNHPSPRMAHVASKWANHAIIPVVLGYIEYVIDICIRFRQRTIPFMLPHLISWFCDLPKGTTYAQIGFESRQHL
jgi:hypothetical protein